MSILSDQEILKRVLIGELILLDEERRELEQKDDSIVKELEKIKGYVFESLEKCKNNEWKKAKEKYSDAKSENDKLSLELERKLKLNRKKLGMEIIERLAKKNINKPCSLKDIAKDLTELEISPIFIDDFDIKNLKSANYDLRIGEEVYTTQEKYPLELSSKCPERMIKVEPGSFGLFLTHEYIYLPEDIYGLISLRFKYKIQGLVNVSGFHIDPGYHGRILFGIYNSGPSEIILQYKEPIFMISFVNVGDGVKVPYNREPIQEIRPEYIERLIGPPVSLKNVHDRVEKLETYFHLIIYMLITIIAGLSVVFVSGKLQIQP